ncbi:MAG: Wzz/FepE/Etk N-terminal domain-containing protein [Arcobacter sp.]|uniref:Wzz/FepE/Etk N-terminal domain-containing protein n=1 Tax=Arcobacter sp. TaxID=1872629 RepID=UPI003D0136BF
MQNNEQINEDEIDLRELFKTIWEKKIFILLFTSIVTIISIIYVSFKNPIPIYQGKTYIEIGQIQSQNYVPTPLDNTLDLSEILKLELKVDTYTIKTTNKDRTNLLQISSDNKNKEEIKNSLEKAVEFVINRHKEKAKFYENVIMTKQIGDIIIDDNPINKPKKSLIVVVSFVTGFILSIFIVFFMQFINSIRKEDTK